MQAFVGEHASEESKKRLELLNKLLGPKIEEGVRKILGKGQELTIAVIPLGSTLKGYARKDSDLEYTVAILSGAEELDVVLRKKQEEAIFGFINNLIKKAGYKTEKGLIKGVVNIFNYSNIKKFYDHVMFIEGAAYAFFPCNLRSWYKQGPY